MNRKRTIVVGLGPAGAFAVKRLARNNPEQEILLFDANRDGFYARMRLPEYIAGTLTREGLSLGAPDSIASWGCEPHLGERVLKLLPAERKIVSEKGDYGYDSLLLATGSTAFVPPVPGAEGNPRVHSLRSIEDADAILAALKHAKRATVIGGGLLGLEAAHALRTHGVAVEILEAADRLLPRQLEPESSEELARQLKEQGYACRVGVSVQGIEGGSVRLADGLLPETDLILFSAGIRSNVSLAKDAGIACGRGITVDESMRTSCPDVYAAGDCAEFNGMTPGLWMAAKDQGEAAADAICGLPASIAGRTYRPMLKIPGADVSKLRRTAG